MDHPGYYRGLEGNHSSSLPHLTSMDSLDLNLHLAPPPAIDSTPPYPFRPLGSGLGNGIFNFQPVPTPQPMWTRFFLDNPSPSPPSPGEIEFANYHHDYQQSPFWGMDFSDIDTSGPQFDLDLSPLLHEQLIQEHFLQREEEEELEAVLIEREQEQQHEQDQENLNWWRNRRSRTGAGQDAMAEVPQLAVATGGNGGNAAAAAASATTNSAKSTPGSAKKNSSASGSAEANANSADLGEGSEERKGCSKKQDQSGAAAKDFFFDCNVCFDIATEPVVTSCGHLFCWPCLYQWLHIHSHNEECPVCKGAVSDADVIPIYGRGGAAGNGGASCPSAGDASGEIPPRPRARRTDSIRQQNHAGADVVLTEMLRWRRAMRFMHENVERMFHQVGASPAPPAARRPRRRIPRPVPSHFGMEGRSTVGEALMAYHGMPPPTGSGIMGGNMEGMIDQLHHHWPFSVAGAEAPGLNTEPPAYHHVLHGGFRRLPL